MKKRLLVLIALTLVLFTTACGTPREEKEGSESAAVEPETSASAPAESSKPEEPSSTPASSSSEQPSESAPETVNNENPVTQEVPVIRADNFYDSNEAGSNLSVLCPGTGRYWLSYENSKSLLAYMDFTKLTPTDQTNNMEIDSPEPGIVFTASDFSYELRLDQNTNIAVYEIGGDTRYYYSMPEGFYDLAYEWASTYAQYNYSSWEDVVEGENVTTGVNPDGE